MNAKLPAVTFARIAAVLKGKEDRTEFVRRVVEKELERLEDKKAREK
jgi:hypothetical protein